MSATRKDSLKQLCKSILNRLENQKSIAFSPRLRQIIQDEVAQLVGPAILTEEDVRDKTLAKMGARADAVDPEKFSESDQYRAAKAVIVGGLGDDTLHGFYFQKPLKTVAQMISAYLMRSSHIDDVYETDEDLERAIVDTVKKFDPASLH